MIFVSLGTQDKPFNRIIDYILKLKEEIKELEDIEYYMLHYKDLHWKKIDLNGWDDKATAQAILKKCHEDYKKKFWK